MLYDNKSARRISRKTCRQKDPTDIYLSFQAQLLLQLCRRSILQQVSFFCVQTAKCKTPLISTGLSLGAGTYLCPKAAAGCTLHRQESDGTLPRSKPASLKNKRGGGEGDTTLDPTAPSDTSRPHCAARSSLFPPCLQVSARTTRGWVKGRGRGSGAEDGLEATLQMGVLSQLKGVQ